MHIKTFCNFKFLTETKKSYSLSIPYLDCISNGSWTPFKTDASGFSLVVPVMLRDRREWIPTTLLSRVTVERNFRATKNFSRFLFRRQIGCWFFFLYQSFHFPQEIKKSVVDTYEYLILQSKSQYNNTLPKLIGTSESSLRPGSQVLVYFSSINTFSAMVVISLRCSRTLKTEHLLLNWLMLP